MLNSLLSVVVMVSINVAFANVYLASMVTNANVTMLNKRRTNQIVDLITLLQLIVLVVAAVCVENVNVIQEPI